MSDFIVSARKYRPATFASVVGQKHITSTLKNAIERGQLAHAYLFCGPRGVGKTTCARIFAKAINCMNPQGAEACNECESCRSFNEGRSLNIHELDAASNNSVEDIRSLIEQVRIIPQLGRYSVFIIDEVHMLSTAAFNAFLKTLEEPPAHAIFILATTEKHKILPTILSRCQIYDFNRIRVEDAVEYLKYIASQEGITADDESLNLIAQKADGGMRDALSMFDKAVSFCGSELRYQEVAQTLNVLDYDTYFQMTDTLLAGNYADALIAFDQVLARGFSGQTFMAGLNRHMRDLLVAGNNQTVRLLEFTGTLMERYRTQAGACPPKFLFGATTLLTGLACKIRQSSHGRLLVELGLMKIAGLGQKKNNPDRSVTYSLPPLTATPASAPSITPEKVGQPATTTATTVSKQSETPSAGIPTPAKVQTTAETPIQNASPQPATGVPNTNTGTETRSETITRSDGTTSTPRPRMSRLASGISISELVNGSSRQKESSETVAATAPEPVYDPASTEKLEQGREKILTLIQQQRPRFVAAFEKMAFEGHTIRISVATSVLREEILRNKTELLMRIAETVGINGMLELDVAVNEQIKASKPIKLEDRVKYMTEKNPLLTELRRALDLEVE